MQFLNWAGFFWQREVQSFQVTVSCHVYNLMLCGQVMKGVTNRMDQSQFWQIIEQAKQESGGDGERQVELVKSQLNMLPLEDVKAFERIYQFYHGRSYNKWLWRAIDQFVGFVSDDSFHYFRAWLIAQGEGIFREVVQHPGRVGEFVDPDNYWLEELNYVAYDVYKHRAGQDLWEALSSQEDYPISGYDWLQPTPPEEGFSL